VVGIVRRGLLQLLRDVAGSLRSARENLKGAAAEYGDAAAGLRWVDQGEVDLREALEAAEKLPRLIALASVAGWDDEGELGGGEVWDKLYEEGLLRNASDQTGERWPVITERGRRELREGVQGL
jgi:hypothetical protein